MNHASSLKSVGISKLEAVMVDASLYGQKMATEMWQLKSAGYFGKHHAKHYRITRKESNHCNSTW